MRNTSPFGILCGNGARGGPGGGHSSDAANKDCSNYNSYTSFSCGLQPNDAENFSQSQFMRFLQAQVEKEIRHSGATVVERERLQPSGFLLTYREQGINGKIKITGRLEDEESFHLDIIFNEESSSIKNPPLSFKAKRYQPTGNFHIVAFTDAEEASEHIKKWGRLCADREKLLRIKLFEDFSARNLEQVVAYWWRTFDSLPLRIREKMADAVYPEPVPAEYKRFAAVHYLNDAALRMFANLDLDLPILTTLPAEEIALISFTPMRKNYCFSPE